MHPILRGDHLQKMQFVVIMKKMVKIGIKILTAQLYLFKVLYFFVSYHIFFEIKPFHGFGNPILA